MSIPAGPVFPAGLAAKRPDPQTSILRRSESAKSLARNRRLSFTPSPVRREEGDPSSLSRCGLYAACALGSGFLRVRAFALFVLAELGG